MSAVQCQLSKLSPPLPSGHVALSEQVAGHPGPAASQEVAATAGGARARSPAAPLGR